MRKVKRKPEKFQKHQILFASVIWLEMIAYRFYVSLVYVFSEQYSGNLVFLCFRGVLLFFFKPFSVVEV